MRSPRVALSLITCAVVLAVVLTPGLASSAASLTVAALPLDVVEPIPVPTKNPPADPEPEPSEEPEQPPIDPVPEIPVEPAPEPPVDESPPVFDEPESDSSEPDESTFSEPDESTVLPVEPAPAPTPTPSATPTPIPAVDIFAPFYPPSSGATRDLLPLILGGTAAGLVLLAAIVSFVLSQWRLVRMRSMTVRPLGALNDNTAGMPRTSSGSPVPHNLDISSLTGGRIGGSEAVAEPLLAWSPQRHTDSLSVDVQDQKFTLPGVRPTVRAHAQTTPLSLALGGIFPTMPARKRRIAYPTTDLSIVMPPRPRSTSSASNASLWKMAPRPVAERRTDGAKNGLFAFPANYRKSPR
jgi:hypothetical protein